MEQSVHVLHSSAAIGKTGGAEEALQVAEHDENAESVDEGGGDGEDDEEGKGRDVSGVAANDGVSLRGPKRRALMPSEDGVSQILAMGREVVGLTGQDLQR